MKKFYLILALLSATYANGQRVQGTLKPAVEDKELIIAIKPTAAFTAQITNLAVAVQIPTSVGARPTISFTNLQPSLFGTWTTQDDDQGDGFYTYSFNCVVPGGSNTSSTNWTTAELDVLRVKFSGPPITTQVRICHYLDGGTSGFAIFYVETNLAAINNGVLSDWGNLFYTSGAVNAPQAPGNIGVPNAGYSYGPISGFTIPVKFNGFTAVKKDNNALLNWFVENESAITDRYEVERSVNGVNFTKVFTVAPKALNGGTNSYDLTDFNLSSIKASGVIYYRIKQIDKDGKFVYTEIRSVRLDSKGFGISVYPNPVKNITNLTLDLDAATDVSIKVTDAAGKEVQKLQLQGNKGINVQKINMSGFASGSYVINVIAGEEIKTLPVVKIN